MVMAKISSATQHPNEKERLSQKKQFLFPQVDEIESLKKGKKFRPAAALSGAVLAIQLTLVVCRKETLARQQPKTITLPLPCLILYEVLFHFYLAWKTITPA